MKYTYFSFGLLDMSSFIPTSEFPSSTLTVMEPFDFSTEVFLAVRCKTIHCKRLID